MTGVLLVKGKFGHRERHTQRKDELKRRKEKTAVKTRTLKAIRS